MSAHVTRWSCDGCATETTATLGEGGPPNGWNIRDGADDRTLILCGPCTVEHDRFKAEGGQGG